MKPVMMAQQVRAFRDQLPTLIDTHLGKYAMIHDGTITVHDTQDEAMKAGCEAFGDPENFLVKPIRQ